MKKKLTNNKLSVFLNKQTVSVSIITLIVAILGVHFIIGSHATSPFTSTEAESGKITGSASIQNDTNASAGKFIKFGAANNNSGFVTVCGLSLCINGQNFTIHGATAYGTYSQPSTEIALAQASKINTLELVEFDTQYHTLSDTESTATWTRVDQFIADAKAAGIHVILNLSEFGQSLQKLGITPTTIDYNTYTDSANSINTPYLSFIANRTNTITGVQYKNDPTIAKVEIFGEICFPGESDTTCPAGTSGTTAQMQSYFSRTENEWHSLAPNILISSGGFSHLDSTDNPTGVSSGIPYQAIYNDPANSVCDLEVNSTNDYNNSVPKVTNYCKQIGKPWFLSAWSSCYQDTGYPYYLATDQAMATHAQDMYNLVHGQSPSNEVGIGSDFWNLRDIGVSAGHCDIGPAYPLTWSTIQNN